MTEFPLELDWDIIGPISGGSIRLLNRIFQYRNFPSFGINAPNPFWILFQMVLGYTLAIVYVGEHGHCEEYYIHCMNAHVGL